MYCPAHFKEDRPAILAGLIEQFPLATIITNSSTGLTADHIPLYHEPGIGSFGKLIGHVAKSNPLWRISPDQELLVIFQGPSTYISPNWYATKQETGKVVPTWNYAVVHAHATLAIKQEPKDILAIITKLTELHEASQPHQWKVTDAPSDFTEKLLDSIVGIECLVKRIEGKWKVSQNQPTKNQAGVINGLIEHDNDLSSQMAALVKSFGEK